MVAGLELSSIEQHDASADFRKVVLQFEVAKNRALGDDVFQQGSQVGYVPLSVAEFVNEPVLGLLGETLNVW